MSIYEYCDLLKMGNERGFGMSDVFLCDVCPTLPFIQESLLGQLSLDSRSMSSNPTPKSILPSDPPYVPTPCATAVAILIVVVEQT